MHLLDDEVLDSIDDSVRSEYSDDHHLLELIQLLRISTWDDSLLR
jgi:hypothetical protein